MAKIDLEKLICSLAERNIFLRDALNEQGFEYKDGEIVEVQKPKFKVGDWIVQEDIGVYKVVEVCESWYEVVDNEDKHYSIGFDKEYMCHIWTIQGAKDGDVLALISGQCIFLFDGNNKEYCHYSKITDNFSPNYDYMGFIQHQFVPATKEQRDLLFQKMHEAGYEWDADKKELKKIEPKFKVGDKIKYNGDIYVITEVNKNKNWYDVIVLSISGSEGKVCSCIGFGAEDKMKLVQEPCARIYFADFNGGEGYYKLSLDNLNKKQVEAIEALVADWNKKV